MKGLLLLLLFGKLYLARGNANLYQSNYKEDFYSFVTRINEIQQKSLVQELFSNLDRDNSSDKCSQDLKKYRDSIASREAWAIILLDSSGISFSGLLSGNTISLGNYKQCLSTSLKNFSTSYCVVEFSTSNEQTFLLPWVPQNVPVVFTLCVPETCKNKQLETLLELSSIENNAIVTVECQSRRPGFTFGDVFTMSLFIIVWMVIISTTMSKKWIPIKNEAFHKVLDSFSIQRNLTTLLKTNTRCTHLSSLHGLRVLSQCIIVWYHISLFKQEGNYPNLNKFYDDDFFRSWKGAIVTELVLSVDTFFVIGGILLTWNALEKKKNFKLISYYTHRYLRLTPPYLATLLITSTFVSKLCDGPLCINFIDKEKKACDSYWWTNLLYINNFYPGVRKLCMQHSWYLAADWQLFFFISPFVVIVINKWPHHIYKLINTIFLTSVITTFLVSYLYHLPTEKVNNRREEHYDYYQKVYFAPYTRAGPWAIGMFCGVILHNFKKNPMKISNKVYLIAWLLTVLGLSLSLELILPFLSLQNTESGAWSSLYNTFQRNLWSVSIGWIIFSSGTQKAGFLGRFLGWPVFQPLAKLSYSAYLIHMVFVHLYLGETYGYGSTSASTMIPVLLGIIFLSYAAALLKYLSFEAPTIYLENILFHKETKGNHNRNGIGGNDSAPEITTINRNNIQDLELPNAKYT